MVNGCLYDHRKLMKNTEIKAIGKLMDIIYILKFLTDAWET